MAASVLGKRTRSTFAVEETSLPLQSRKRRTRNATPRIHSDNAEPTKTQTYQDAAESMDIDGPQLDIAESARPPPTRNVRKRTVQDKRLQFRTSKLFLEVDAGVTIQDENVPPTIEFETPTAIRFRDASPAKIPITPRHHLRLNCNALTPHTSRTTLTSRPQTVYSVARQLFTQSSSPGKLIGRDSERQQIKSFVSEAITTSSGGCLYVSGPPGTGKSALVQEVLADVQAKDLLRSSYINCVSTKTSREVHNRLLEAFCPDVAVGKKSHQDVLGKLFTAKRQTATRTHLVVLDEMDSLLDVDCDVLYSLFDWALHKSSCLVLIGIANALDLTDRFLPLLKARNLKPRLLPFMPYSAKQISEIITERLRSTLPADTVATKDFVPFIHPAAIQLSSKKVAAQTGDLRKAFNLVRRAIDQVEKETLQKNAIPAVVSPSKQPLSELPNLARQLPLSPPTSSPLKPDCIAEQSSRQDLQYTPETAPRASIAHVARLSSSIFNNSTSSRLAGLNLQQKAVLCSLVAGEKERATRDPFSTPSKSAARTPTVKELFTKYAMLCKRDDGLLHPLKITEFRDVVASLETLGLVHESSGRASSLLTPAQTPSRIGRNPDEKQFVSGVSEKEMSDSLKGLGADLLMRLFDEK